MYISACTSFYTNCNFILSLHRLLELVKTIGKQYVVWQEIFDNKLEVLPDTVIHVWKGGDNWPKEVYNITKAGLKTLLSSCWYLNYISYGEDWPKVSTQPKHSLIFLSYLVGLDCQFNPQHVSVTLYIIMTLSNYDTQLLQSSCA